MKTLTVALGDRSYPIHIGPGLIHQPQLIAGRLPQNRAAVVTNSTVGPVYLSRLLDRLASVGVETIPVVLPDGEHHKNWETLNIIFNALLTHRCERRRIQVAAP